MGLYIDVFRKLGLAVGVEVSAGGKRLEVFLPGAGDGLTGRFDPTQIPEGKRSIGTASHNNKPRGAFWTSSLDFEPLLVKRADGPGSRTTGHCTCSWLKWMAFEMPEWIGEHAAIYRVHPDARVLRIEDWDACYQLHEKYRRWGSESGLHWGQIAKDYDGVWAAGNFRPVLKTWDMPSTAWFTHAPLELVGVWPLLKGEADPEEDPWRERLWAIDLTQRVVV